MVRCRPAARQGRSGDDGNRTATMLGGEQCGARSEKMEAVLTCSPVTATTGHSGAGTTAGATVHAGSEAMARHRERRR
ncbi:hypothetical protein E2562_010512 [Oryza meyeriana var. granulata]|uniref:Uncharacterized protein n=1 Tax=Oryza meyeriana var. granulata TaxID=110450 RepID=A0A6G1DW92_9ORYZ|nr:hypothetical protein E2562_010512 [Oryza meyeriana var. granulata]